MSQETQIQEIEDGLAALFDGKDKRLSIVAACSIAATTAHLIGMSKLDLQVLIIRLYDKRTAESTVETEPIFDRREE